MHTPRRSSLLLAAFASACAQDDAETEVTRALETRLEHDRTGACVAAALLEGDAVTRVVRCSDQGERRRLDTRTPFEIGSLTKTMTAFLLADAVRRGELTLDTELSELAPKGVVVPSFEGTPIRLSDLATHVSGLPRLPPRMEISDPDDPYATLSDDVLWSSLDDVALGAAPGSSWSYSNFGFMLLSELLADAGGADFSALLSARLFEPLGMASFVITPGSDAPLGRGHDGRGKRVPHWHTAPDLAGAGGVAASLDDLVRYAQALLGDAPPEVANALQETLRLHAAPPDGPEMGLGWLLGAGGARNVVFHDGGTGGYSSFFVLDRTRRRAVILLSDTSLANLGGLGPLGEHLLAPDEKPAPAARLRAEAPAELLDALAGSYQLEDLTVTLSVVDGKLVGAVADDTLHFDFDSYGDFFPRELDALLTPVPRGDGHYDFDWIQGGAATRAELLP